MKLHFKVSLSKDTYCSEEIKLSKALSQDAPGAHRSLAWHELEIGGG